jgi:hypothetical protein
LLQWWDKLSVPVLSKLGQEKGLAVEARDTLLEILVYDEDESELDDVAATSKAMAHNLLATWLAKSRHASEEFDEHARFVEGQIQMILLAFGKKRPKVWTEIWAKRSIANGRRTFSQQLTNTLWKKITGFWFSRYSASSYGINLRIYTK